MHKRPSVILADIECCSSPRSRPTALQISELRGVNQLAPAIMVAARQINKLPNRVNSKPVYIVSWVQIAISICSTSAFRNVVLILLPNVGIAEANLCKAHYVGSQYMYILSTPTGII